MLGINRMKTKQLLNELESAWGIIANAGGGDWKKEPKDWQTVAAKWRERYHKINSAQEPCDVKKLNAKNFFVELIHSLAPGKDLTPTQRSQYKRVLAFLDA